MRGVSDEVRKAARELRRAGTPAEERLWRAIRGGSVGGLKFRRQHALGNFVLDFYCPSRKLVVEVDGEVHDRQIERDEARTAALAAHGCTVVRFRNDEVLNQLPSVLNRIRTAARSCSPLPELGEGGGSKAAG